MGNNFMFISFAAAVLFMSIQCCICEEEFGVCAFESYPSTLGNPDPQFDGTFETYPPLAQHLWERGVYDAVPAPGCVCRRNEVSPVKYVDQFGSLEGFDDVACVAACTETKAALGFLDGSNAFLTGVYLSGGSSTTSILSYNILNDQISAEYPNLRFYLGFSTNVSQDWTIRLRPTFQKPDSLEIITGLDLLFLQGSTDPMNTTDCNGVKWSRYTISLLPLLNDPQFIAANASLKNSGLTLLMFLFPGVHAAIDNVEFVGPANNTLDVVDTLTPLKVTQDLPSSTFSLTGEDPLDAVVFISVAASVVAAVVLTVLLICRKPVPKLALKVFSAVWVVLSTLISVYAVVEYLAFVEEIDALNIQTNETVQEIRSIVRTPGFDPRQLQLVTDGVPVFGALSLAIPPLEREAWERVVTFKDNAEQSCQTSRISDGTCMDSASSYFASIELGPSASIEEVTTQSSMLQGTITASVDHYLEPLLYSLIGDLLLTLVILVVLVFSKRSALQHAVELILAGLNLFFAGFLLALALSDTVRYNPQINLVDFRTKNAISVEAKRTFTSAEGDFLVDSAGLGISNTCFSDSPGVGSVGQQFRSWITNFKQGQREEFFPLTIGTELEVCKWNNMISTFPNALANDTLCIAFDCSEGVIALVRSETAAPFNDFVENRIVWGILLIDFLVSFVDILVMVQAALTREKTINNLENTKSSNDKMAEML